MTRKEYKNLKVGDVVWFVEGGLPEVYPYISKDKVVKKEKDKDGEWVYLETSGLIALKFPFAYLTKEEARDDLNRTLEEEGELYDD